MGDNDGMDRIVGGDIVRDRPVRAGIVMGGILRNFGLRDCSVRGWSVKGPECEGSMSGIPQRRILHRAPPIREGSV